MKVLIVDDTDTWRMLVGQYLRNVPGVLLVGEAENGAQALEKCRTLQPDVVLLDISLPDAKGVDIARLIKQESAHIHVYLYSAYEVGEIRELSLTTPADGFIQKSSLKTELLSVIEKERTRIQAAKA